MRRSNVQAALVRALESELQIGDLVLTGSGDILSKAIRWGTLGSYSHSLVALDGGRLIESFDWSGTPAENDAGLRTITIGRLVYRGSLRRIEVLRAADLEPQRILNIADNALANPPTFPTSGALLLGFAGLGDHPHVRFPPIRWLMDRCVEMLGDGALRTTCAEFATRLYLDAGLPLRFERPRLGRYIERVASNEVEGLIKRRPTPGLPVPDARVGPVRSALDRMAMPLGIASERHDCDAADLIVPSDFSRCAQFESVLQVALPR